MRLMLNSMKRMSKSKSMRRKRRSKRPKVLSTRLTSKRNLMMPRRERSRSSSEDLSATSSDKLPGRDTTRLRRSLLPPRLLISESRTPRCGPKEPDSMPKRHSRPSLPDLRLR
jgi:hypothetical protein